MFDPILTPPRVDEDAFGSEYLLAPSAIPFSLVTIADVIKPLAEVVAALYVVLVSCVVIVPVDPSPLV